MNTPAATCDVCRHPPTRLFAWWAYNCLSGKDDILCVGCCECGAVLAGAADDEEHAGDGLPAVVARITGGQQEGRL